jgi:SNF2 family DNA or RNA helicase
MNDKFNKSKSSRNFSNILAFSFDNDNDNDNDDDDDDGECEDILGPATDNEDVSLAATVLARCGITKMTYTAFSNQMSTKVAWLVQQLVQMHAQNAALKPSPALRDRAVVFCEWHNEMNLIAMALKRCNVRPLLYHGGMSLQERDATLHKFGMTLHPLAEDVLLIQIRSGSEGLNLQMANRIYIMSPTWNPCIEAQAIGRVVRLGQGCERNVVITRLVMSGTVEERCLEIQERKKALVQKAMRDNSLAMKLGAALTKADIQAIIGTQTH